MMQGAILAHRRRVLERHIEVMIGLLDQIDGDPDLEPLNGWPAEGPHVCRHVNGDHDSETEDEREFDEAEYGIGDMDGLIDMFGADQAHLWGCTV